MGVLVEEAWMEVRRLWVGLGVPSRVAWAATLLLGLAIINALMITVASVGFDWGSYIDALSRQAIAADADQNAVVGLALMQSLCLRAMAVGVLVAFPVNAALRTVGRAAWGWIAGVVMFVSWLCAWPFFGWWIIPGSVASAAATAFLLTSPAREFAKRSFSPVRTRTRFLGTAVVLLIGFGPFGGHNYYLKRSWAGLMQLGLLLIGTLAWGGFVSWAALAGLGVALVCDGVRLHERIAELNSRYGSPRSAGRV
ncbi:hypothetical protein [uncultured Leifsonia sp.]|uniref:hypothetical protein n=1 Tax=uncultured Leifsonia sp. TaxID=340359 RepID=UPI0025E63ADF|nr:hypothetical protein [uncultured Leifsonia sp.]